jgi:hypothetical protein
VKTKKKITIKPQLNLLEKTNIETSTYSLGSPPLLTPARPTGEKETNLWWSRRWRRRVFFWRGGTRLIWHVLYLTRYSSLKFSKKYFWPRGISNEKRKEKVDKLVLHARTGPASQHEPCIRCPIGPISIQFLLRVLINLTYSKTSNPTRVAGRPPVLRPLRSRHTVAAAHASTRTPPWSMARVIRRPY